MTEDPLWPRASAWLGSGGPDAPLAVLGAPLSATSISPSGAHATPTAVRQALRRFTTYHAGLDTDLEAVPAADLGDVPLAGLDVTAALAAIAASVADVAAPLLVVLGGDNAVTRPAMAARLGDALPTGGLLTLDAHHDVRGYHAGITNGTPVRGLLADGLDGRNVVQIGIGALTNSRAYRDWCGQRGVTAVGVDQARVAGLGACVRRHLDALASRCGALWVDLDVDVLDSAFAPGCPGARPGGLLPGELFAAARAAGAHPAVVGVDIVEVDATADPDGRTVDIAAQCLLEVAAGLAAR